MEKAKDSLLAPCGHKAFCYACGVAIQRRSAACPICRTAIREVVRVFD